MRITIPTLDQLLPQVRQALETMVGRINLIFEKQHTGDGAHAAITCSSLASSGAISGTAISGTTVAASGAITGASLAVTGAVSGASVSATGAVSAGTSVAAGTTVTAGTSFFEHGRGTALGEWPSPTFNAGDYTGSGTITWTLTSGDVVTLAYTLVGKTMTVSVVLLTTTVAGAGAVLQILIPGGFTAAKTMRNACEAIDNGVRTTARIGVAAGGTNLLIQRTDAANWTAAVDNTAVSAQLSFEVQ